MAFPEDMEEEREEVEVEEMPEEDLLDEEIPEEVEVEEDVSVSPSLEEGVSRLVEEWNPETPEGERYLQELKEVMSGSGEDVMEEGVEGEMVEEEEPGPAGGFDIVAMRNRAAKNAFPEMT